MSSQSVNVWAKTESTAGRRNFRRLKVGRMIDTAGRIDTCWGDMDNRVCARCEIGPYLSCVKGSAPSGLGVGSPSSTDQAPTGDRISDTDSATRPGRAERISPGSEPGHP